MTNALFFLLPSITLASFCGQTAIPFTFQALRNGQPVLGCARPRCFGWTANGTNPGEPAQFYRIHGKEDGYMRKIEIATGGTTASIGEISACAMSFGSSNCGIGQWVGGIAPQSEVRQGLLLRCCSYGPLLQSEDRGIASVKTGQLVVGGEVTVDNRVVAFDYVSDVAKTVKEDGIVEYNVAIRRMSCFDSPNDPQSISRSSSVHRQPSDVSLQQITDQQPQPYSPWGNQDSQSSIQTTTPPVPIPQTEYPGQPIDLQLQSSPTPYPRRYVSSTTSVPVTTTTQSQTVPQMSNPFMMQQPNMNIFTFPTLPPMHNFVHPHIMGIPQFTPQQQSQIPQVAPKQHTQQVSQHQFVQQNAQQVQPQAPQQQQTSQFQQVQQVPMGMGNMQVPGMGELPTLEKLPKLNIPSIEEVENAIPPVEKAILTTVARFFGVL